MKKVNSTSLCLLACLFTATTVQADPIGDAARLLRIARAGERFESVAQRQTRDILRSYSSIVSMEAAVSLPQSVKDSISACYADVYAWGKFEPGITRILAENLSQKQILLLIDFYQDLSLPPMEIQTFKDTIAKAPEIQRLSVDYIYKHSASCVDRDAVLIFDYLARLATGHAPVASNWSQ